MTDNNLKIYVNSVLIGLALTTTLFELECKLNSSSGITLTFQDTESSLKDTYIDGANPPKWSQSAFKPVEVWCGTSCLFMGRVTKRHFQNKQMILQCSSKAEQLHDHVFGTNQEIIPGSGYVKGDYNYYSGKVTAIADYTYSEDFNAIADHALPTGWVGDDAEKDTLGPDELLVVTSSNDTGYARMPFVGFGEGYIQFKMYVNPVAGDQTNMFGYIKFLDAMGGSTSRLTLKTVEDGADYYLKISADGTTYTNVSIIALETWYTVKLVFDMSASTVDVYLDAVLKNDDYAVSDLNKVTQCVEYSMTTTEAGEHDLYIDDITMLYENSKVTVSENDDAETAFTWTTDEMIAGRDWGVIFDDDTAPTTTTWVADAVISNDWSTTFGAITDTNTNNGAYYQLQDTAMAATETFVFTVTGAAIDSTTDTVDSISLALNALFHTGTVGTNYTVRFYIYDYTKDDGTYVEINPNVAKVVPVTGLLPPYENLLVSIAVSNIADYLHKTGDDYDKAKIKVVATKNGTTSTVIRFDYIGVIIAHHTAVVSDTPCKIIGNGASYLYVNQDVTTLNVNVDDLFSIGENSRTILQQVGTDYGLEFIIDDDFDNYTCNNYRGEDGLSVIESIMKLEEGYWFEYFLDGNHKIYLYKSANFPASGCATITSTLYGTDYDIEMPANQYKAVRVIGNGDSSIEAYLEDDSASNESPLEASIVDNNIMTNFEALQIATAMLNKIKTERDSYIVTVLFTDFPFVGHTASATFERPTIANATYPIRKAVYRIQYPNGLKTVQLSLGLGETSKEEHTSNLIKKSVYDTNKALLRIRNKTLDTMTISHQDTVNRYGTGNYHISAAEAAWVTDLANESQPAQFQLYPYNGFVQTQLNGMCYSVANSDADARVAGNAICPATGSYKIVIGLLSSQAGITVAGALYVGNPAENGAYDITSKINNVATSHVCTDANKIYWVRSSAISLTKNTMVTCAWTKTDNSGAGTCYLYAIWLERQ